MGGLDSRPRIRRRFRRRSFPRHAGPLSTAHERVRVPNLRILATPTTRAPQRRPLLCRTACAGSYLRTVLSMLRPAVLPRRSRHRRSWVDSHAAGDRMVRLLRCTLGAIRHRSFLWCEGAGPDAVLCGVWVSGFNLSLIGVIYGSGGSVHMRRPHVKSLSGARAAARRAWSSVRSQGLYSHGAGLRKRSI